MQTSAMGVIIIQTGCKLHV